MAWWLVPASAALHLTSSHLSPFANHPRSEQSRGAQPVDYTPQPGLAWLCLTLAVIDHGSGCGGPATALSPGLLIQDQAQLSK